MSRYRIVTNIAAYDARFDTFTVVDVDNRKSLSRHDSKAEALAAIEFLTTEKTNAYYDLYEQITARILTELEKGAVPWVRPWSATSRLRPRFVM
jgi:hypothetical protein